jgi:electron transfer flavoprotein alpha subunit
VSARKDVLVVAELREGRLKKTALEAATAGRALADALGGRLAAVVAGEGLSTSASDLARHGVDRVLTVEGEAYRRHFASALRAVVLAAAERSSPRLILFSGTLAGKETAPAVAAALDVAYVADAIALAVEEPSIVATKPKYAGKAIARVDAGGDVVVATLRGNVVAPKESPRQGTSEPLAVAPPPPRVRLKEVVPPAEREIELTEADAIVSGGRGLGSPDAWHLVIELAKALGAAHGASRAVVDAGWRPHSEQVGQTGKTVSPKLYVACGISGAIQHLAGMSSSKAIVAINKDADAPIFGVADYGIVGDLHQILPLLTEEAKAFLQK